MNPMGIEYDASDVSKGFSQGAPAGGRKRRPLKFSADAVEKAKRRFTSSPAASSGQLAINTWCFDHRAGPATQLCRCLTTWLTAQSGEGCDSGCAVSLYRLLPMKRGWTLHSDRWQFAFAVAAASFVSKRAHRPNNAGAGVLAEA